MPPITTTVTLTDGRVFDLAISAQHLKEAIGSAGPLLRLPLDEAQGEVWINPAHIVTAEEMTA